MNHNAHTLPHPRKLVLVADGCMGIRVVKEKWVRVHLTKRDLELLQEMTTGEPMKVIAVKLGLTHRTAKLSVQMLYLKLGVTLRSEAVSLALRNGWVK